MKKQIRKLKKQLLKHLEAAKQEVKAQLFYVVDVLDNVKTTIAKTVIVCLCLGLVITCSSLVHDTYIEQKVGSNVVFLRSPEGAKIQGSATGFEVVTPSGKVYTLTNAHVCELQKDGLVMAGEKHNSGRLIPLRVVEVYEENDLCLLEGLNGYSGLKLADSISRGQHGWAVGYPLGQEMNISQGRIKGFGHVSIPDSDPECKGPHKSKITIQYLMFDIELCQVERSAAQTDVPTYPGNSGSPLVNAWGNVIGVMFASQSTTAWGSAVPLKDVEDFLSAY